MNFNYKIAKNALLVLLVAFAIASCQKMERPELKELVLDPPPPPYSPLKSFWAFDGNVGDSGQERSSATATNVTFIDGVNGQAAKIGEDGYVLVKSVSDSIKNLGSFTLAFWMNGVGPVNGAQGLFSISNSNQFWGNLDLFLESDDNGSEGFLKVHMFNDAAANGGEEWTEVKIPNALNKWTHIAVVYDSSNSQLSIYADGAPTSIANKVLGGGNYGAIKYKDVNGLVVGTYQFQTSPSLTNHGPEDWANSFNGALDQFRLYNRPLSAAEVQNLYNNKE